MENNPSHLWEKCLSIIHDNISQQQFDTWFKCINLCTFKDHKLTLIVPSPFVYEFVEEHYLDLLRKTITKVFGKDVTLTYKVLEDAQNDIYSQIDSSNKTNLQPSHTTRPANVTPEPVTSAVADELDSQLNPNYNFENFIEGASNKLVRSVGEAISKTPSRTFNPLFIYGHSGVGKTHLVNAIGLRTKELHPRMRVLYVSAHLFQVQYTDAVRNNKVNEFITFYQTIDMLIIDDIQELSGKTKTQQTFFHIFNHLHINGKQIIMTADRPPIEIIGLEERLLTRFKWGLQAEIEKPNQELRRMILEDKIRKNGLMIAPNVVDFISKNVSENIRDLEGIINSLLAHSVVYNNCDIDMQLVNTVLPRFMPKRNTEITIDFIIETVCNYFNVSSKDICSQSRRQPYIYIRQVAIYLANKHTDVSNVQIGKAFGGRNHATVLHSITQMKNLIETEEKTATEISKIEDLLVGG